MEIYNPIQRFPTSQWFGRVFNQLSYELWYLVDTSICRTETVVVWLKGKKTVPFPKSCSALILAQLKVVTSNVHCRSTTINFCIVIFSDRSEASEDEDGLKMELLGSSGRGGRRSFSERKLISDLGGHGTPQKELLHFLKRSTWV